MRVRDRFRGRVSERRRSISRSLCYGRPYSRSPGYYSPSPRHSHYSRSMSPRYQTYRERSYSRSPYGTRYRERAYSRSPYDSRSRSQSQSASAIRVRSPSLEGYLR
ncbi:E1 envelope glycoprotein [Actinidia chinensis var. chinensis]|uniref:E1 envelope glycoprotein n=1 Tax=Actinidia chinensis var. chinensis TaxID=1590841 RepID=A0A2R6S1X2_ACTCC|nr:E1 envelope glycoprotein [Actinidia chinensis var. chinensis]